MSTKDDGGPAFPMYNELGSLNSEGMSLRDYFAAAALQGFAMIHAAAIDRKGLDLTPQVVTARFAYQIADAMLIEREMSNG